MSRCDFIIWRVRLQSNRTRQLVDGWFLRYPSQQHAQDGYENHDAFHAMHYDRHPITLEPL
jgi:hypothetical protein